MQWFKRIPPVVLPCPLFNGSHRCLRALARRTRLLSFLFYCFTREYNFQSLIALALLGSGPVGTSLPRFLNS